MSSHKEIDRKIDPRLAFDPNFWSEFSYSYPNGPHKEYSLTELKEIGLNCVSLAHLMIESLGMSLSSRLRCAELFFDQNETKFIYLQNLVSKLILDQVEPIDQAKKLQLQPGDLFFFGDVKFLEEIKKFSQSDLAVDDNGELKIGKFRLHLAVQTGLDEKGQPKLLHANVVEDAVSLWSLDEFCSHQRYQLLYAIKRCTRLNPALINLISD